MSSVLCRGGGCTVFRVIGELPDTNHQSFADAMEQQRFRTIENACSEEVSVGWVTPVDPTGDSFTMEDFDAGIGSWLRFRVDKKSMPAAWLRMHQVAVEKANGKKLSAKERRELKDELMDRLLPRVLPTVAVIDALLFEDRVYLFSTSKAACETLALLWNQSFGSILDQARPRQLGAMKLGDAAAMAMEKLNPMRWPVAIEPAATVSFEGKVVAAIDEMGVAHPPADAGVQQSFGFDTTFGFLGEEFLTWLWFKWETEGGEFYLPNGRIVGIAIDDMLAFAAKGDDEHEQTIRHGLPTRTAEARAGLRMGHRLAKARIIVGEGSRQWTLTLKGETMSLSGVRGPEDADECESPIDRTCDRASNWVAIHNILGGLYSQFLGVRMSDKWTAEAESMAQWMAR